MYMGISAHYDRSLSIREYEEAGHRFAGKSNTTHGTCQGFGVIETTGVARPRVIIILSSQTYVELYHLMCNRLLPS